MVDILKQIGIPAKLYRDFDVTDYTKSIMIRDKQYSALSQNNAFKKTLENPFSDYVFVASVDSNNSIAQQAGKQFAMKIVEKSGNPFWFNVLWYAKDFERLKCFEDEFGGIDALIIDGLFAKTNINHIDTLRILLEKYNGVPIFTIVSGIEGPLFYSSIVSTGYNRFIHFGDEPKKKLKKLEVAGIDDLDDLE